MIGSDRPNTAFIQSGILITVSPNAISKGKVSITMNSRTSQGELRKAWVRNQQTRRIPPLREIWPRPSSTPRTVPIAMVVIEIATLSRKPLETRKGSQRTRASKASAKVNLPWAAADIGQTIMTAASSTMPASGSHSPARASQRLNNRSSGAPAARARTGRSTANPPADGASTPGIARRFIGSCNGRLIRRLRHTPVSPSGAPSGSCRRRVYRRA